MYRSNGRWHFDGMVACGQVGAVCIVVSLMLLFLNGGR
jgi:hypothetical protein